jgi:hypothetical protein
VREIALLRKVEKGFTTRINMFVTSFPDRSE